jgi:hypothetical protein
MAMDMHTGAFSQSCSSSADRINRLSEINSLKLMLQNLTSASQHTARALSVLSLDVIPGTPQPLRLDSFDRPAPRTAATSRPATLPTPVVTTARAAPTPGMYTVQ